MLDTYLEDTFGKRYVLKRQSDLTSQKSFKALNFSDESQAYQFVAKLRAPQGHWFKIISKLGSFSTHQNISSKVRAERIISQLLCRKQIFIYELALTNQTGSSIKRSVQKDNGDSYTFIPVSSLLVAQPREMVNIGTAEDAKKLLDELKPGENKLKELTKELDISIASTAPQATEKLVAAIVSGEVVVSINKPIASPPKRETDTGVTAADKPVGLGPSPSPDAPAEQNQAAQNLAEIRSIASKSPTLTNNLSTLRAQGWTITTGNGSYCDKTTKTITIDSNELNNPTGYVQTIAHESGHALYTPDPYVPPDGLTKQQYVDANANSSLKDEGEATLANITIRNEILQNNGPDIGIAGTQGPAYEQAYKDYQIHGDRDRARSEIGNVFADNERPGIAADKTYKEYYSEPYETYWDENVQVQ